ncbi:MAG: DUF262 and DUF1524 domain-containing protein [Verrucomicrobiota bacterium]
MKASEASFLKFLNDSPQFIIPIYQRNYSWTDSECGQLWDDIVRCGENDNIAVHFVGSIVYIEEGLSQISHRSPLMVIDGQQRLTTVTLLLAAIANSLGDEDEPVLGFTKRKIRSYYLVNNEETGDLHYKLLLSQTDKETLKAIVGENELPPEKSLRISQNYELFREWLVDYAEEVPALCRGLAKLVLVDVALTRGQDNPQLIFESMNSTGKELSQADLIRNYVLMGLPQDLQTRLYENYWRPMELEFGQDGYGKFFDKFMRHYLTVKTREIPTIRGVYDAFKEFTQDSRKEGVEFNELIETLVVEVRRYSRYFCAMALNREEDRDLKIAFNDLRELKVDVAYPFLLELYADYDQGLLSKEDFLAAIRLVESYVFRRAITAIPTNSMNKTFATFHRALNKERYLESIQAHFLRMRSYRRFPTDDEFQRDFQTRDLYHFRSRTYWLRRFENYDRKEPVVVDECTIEHIMPQNENLSAAWRESLGEHWQDIQAKWLHTLGNLTLTRYNSEYNDRAFADKRDMKGGFATSPMKVNEGLGQAEQWNEVTIKERAARLAKEGIEIWKSPHLSTEVLATYEPPKPEYDTYSIEDHPHLQKPEMNEIFEAFRNEVLALDPCVSEEFLKLYVAYRAERSFVDIVPQASRLSLTLNMEHSELNDPRGISKDVAGLGRWGNGNVSVPLASLEELPYVMGLVRQSLELQLGGEEEG